MVPRRKHVSYQLLWNKLEHCDLITIEKWIFDVFCTEFSYAMFMFALFPSHIADHKTLQLTVNYVDLICPHVPSSYLHYLTILWGQHWTKMSISCGILSSLHQMICGQLKHPKLFQPQNNLRVHILFSNYTNIELPLTKISNNEFFQPIIDKVFKCVIGRFSRFSVLVSSERRKNIAARIF